MKDLLARLFWRDAEIHREVAEYLEQFPGFAQANAYMAVSITNYYQSGKSHGTSTFYSLGYALDGNYSVI